MYLLNNGRFIFLFCFFTSLFLSCKKFVEVGPPDNKVVSAGIFTSDATATAAIIGIYANMSNVGFGSGSKYSVSSLAGLSADELTNFNSTDVDQVQFYKNGITATNSYLTNNLWSEAYQYIYASNTIIEGLNKYVGVNDQLKKQLIGESKFIRAFCHFYLVNLFGDVPSITSSDYNTNAIAIRTPASQVYQQIISDLKDAQVLLASDYSYSINERVRPNKWAATALLARAYLYTQDWKNAETQSTSIIDNTSTFGLVSDLNKVFLANSIEAIWQLKPLGASFDTREALNFVFSNVPQNVAMSDQLINAFEVGDLRKAEWVGNVTVNGTLYYYPFKYKLIGASLNEYSMVLRLAEQYLIRSEARIEQNKIVDGIADLNLLRARARGNNVNDLPPLLNSLSQSDALLALAHERQIELFTEWGHRWLDLKRTKRVDSVMTIVTPQKGGSWDSYWQVYPIPQIQLQNDPNMANSQNAGY
jgi:hypothetical protein